MKTHCIPPRQQCPFCRAQVRAAQMDEREWRRTLWRFEVGSKIANGVALGLAGAFVARFVYAVEHEGLRHWATWLAVEATLLIPSAIVAYLWSPTDWSRGPWEGDERESYRAAKVARDQHEETLWETGVEILNAQEEARSELGQVQDRIEAHMRKLEGR